MSTKTSFDNAKKERTRINRKGFFKKLFISLLVIILVIFIITLFHDRTAKKKVEQSEATNSVTKQYAPTSIRYYNSKSDEGYEIGEGYVILHQGDGSYLRVATDGSVHYFDRNGNEYILSGIEARKAQEEVKTLMDSDYAVEVAMGSDFAPNEDPTPQKEVEESLEDKTQRILNDEYGLTLDDFYKTIYEGDATPSEYYSMVEEGYDMNTLIDTALANKKEPEPQTPESFSPDFQNTQGSETSTQEEQITIPQWMDIDTDSSMTAALETLSSSLASGSNTKSEASWNLVNQNSSKQNWYDTQQSGTITQTATLTDRDLAPGSVIPITLLTGINTDLPGEVIGLVRQDVYDTLTGRNILIPKGSRVMADYNSSVSFGQHSVQIAWNQLITTDGRVYSLPGFSGTTPEGYSGVKDKYSDHFWEILGGAMLGSIVNYSSGYVKDQADQASNIAGTELISLLTGSVVDTSTNYVEKYADLATSRQPTITIRTGTQTMLLVNRVFTVK